MSGVTAVLESQVFSSYSAISLLSILRHRSECAQPGALVSPPQRQTILEHPLTETHLRLYLSQFFRSLSSLPKLRIQMCFSTASRSPLILGQPACNALLDYTYKT